MKERQNVTGLDKYTGSITESLGVGAKTTLIVAKEIYKGVEPDLGRVIRDFITEKYIQRRR